MCSSDLVGGTGADAVAAARAALEAGRFEEAATAFGAIADANGGVGARVAEAVAHYEAGDLYEARKAAEAALVVDAKNVPALNLLGLALSDSGQVDTGLQKLEAARTLSSGVWKARVLVNIALTRIDRGETAAASAALTEAKGLVGDNVVILGAIGDAEGALAGLSGKDAGVGPMLGKGDVRGARAVGRRGGGGGAHPARSLNCSAASRA